MTTKLIKNFEVTAERFNFNRDVRIWLFRKGLVDVQVAKPIELVPDDGAVAEPTLELDRGVAQNLLDALWVAGFRPENGEGANAQVSAIKDHLKDMQKIAFKLLREESDLAEQVRIRGRGLE